MSLPSFKFNRMKILITRRPVLKYQVGMVYDVDSNFGADLVKRGLAEGYNPVTNSQEGKQPIETKQKSKPKKTK